VAKNHTNKTLQEKELDQKSAGEGLIRKVKRAQTVRTMLIQRCRTISPKRKGDYERLAAGVPRQGERRGSHCSYFDKRGEGKNHFEANLPPNRTDGGPRLILKK